MIGSSVISGYSYLLAIKIDILARSGNWNSYHQITLNQAHLLGYDPDPVHNAVVSVQNTGSFDR